MTEQITRIRCQHCGGCGNDWEWHSSIGDETRVSCHACNGAGWLRLTNGELEQITTEEVLADSPDEHEYEWLDSPQAEIVGVERCPQCGNSSRTPDVCEHCKQRYDAPPTQRNEAELMPCYKEWLHSRMPILNGSRNSI